MTVAATKLAKWRMSVSSMAVRNQAIHGDDGGSKAFVLVSTLERKTPAVINRGRETIFIQAG
jgi:hypothetical protein